MEKLVFLQVTEALHETNEQREEMKFLRGLRSLEGKPK
jgi:hypothetical protein